jgi:pyruvate/2-oxoglutarate dehydrogenase complex dihydrolipoamide dehydrogenase (E3) component
VTSEPAHASHCSELRGERLLVATGRRPRVQGSGLETVGIEPNPRWIAVDARLRAAERVWAIGDVNGIWLRSRTSASTRGDIVAANILGEPREADYDAVPRVIYTDPYAGAVGAVDAPFSATYQLSDVPKTSAYTRVHEVQRLPHAAQRRRAVVGAYALGPEAGEWMQQTTLAVRARLPLDVLCDTIEPFPTCSEIHAFALEALHARFTRRCRLPAKTRDHKPRKRRGSAGPRRERTAARDSSRRNDTVAGHFI